MFMFCLLDLVQTYGAPSDKMSSEEDWNEDLDEESEEVECHRIFAEEWKTLYCNQELSDVTLVVGKENKEFKAHRLVLAAHSDVMKRMLYGELKEGHEDVIKLPEKDCASFESILKYFYTGCVTLDKSFICQLIEMCDYYNVQKLKRVCCNWLSKHLRVDDVCHYLVFAARADVELLQDCLNWLDNHITEVMKTEGFVQLLAYEHLEKILARDCLDSHEIDLFESLEQWVECDRDSRRDQGVALARQIRLPTMTPVQLLGKVQCSGLVNMADIVKAITLQQPGSTNSYEEESSTTLLRLPKIPAGGGNRLKWSKSAGVNFPKPNLAIVEPTGAVIDLRTTEINVPSSIRVQVISKSSASYTNLYIGFEIEKSIFTMTRSGSRQYGNAVKYDLKAAEVTDSVATLGYSRLLSVSVGCAAYFSLHLTKEFLCTQVNGTTTAKATLGKASQEANTKSTYKLLFRVTGPTERITVAVREDRSPCCKQ